MRETLFIAAVVAVLFGLTVFRYRKQIMAVVRFSRMLKEARSPQDLRQTTNKKRNEPSPLVKCSRCGTWVPENRARRVGSGTWYCSAECIEADSK